LKLSGKMPSDSARLIMVVMGCMRASKQDFRMKVGMMSREQVESEDIRMAFLTSRGVAGRKFDNGGGVDDGLMCTRAGLTVEIKEEHNLLTF